MSPKCFRHIPFPQHHGESCGTGLTSDKVVLCEAAGKAAGLSTKKLSYLKSLNKVCPELFPPSLPMYCFPVAAIKNSHK